MDDNALDDLLKGPDGEVAGYVTRLAIQAAGIAQELCPVDTGNLRTHIRWAVQSEDSGIVGYIGSDVNYAIYPEMGTMYQEPQPYLRPAVAQVVEESTALSATWLL